MKNWIAGLRRSLVTRARLAYCGIKGHVPKIEQATVNDKPYYHLHCERCKCTLNIPNYKGDTFGLNPEEIKLVSDELYPC